MGYEPRRTLLFARLYEEGDSIDWHYDQNNTLGRRHTAILPIDVPACSAASFQYREPCTGDVVTPEQGEGRVFVYEGDRLMHRVTRQRRCRRFVLILALWETEERTRVQAARHTLVSALSRFVDF